MRTKRHRADFDFAATTSINPVERSASFQSNRSSSTRRKPTNAPIATYDRIFGSATSKSRAVCSTVKMPTRDKSSFALTVASAEFVAQNPCVLTKENVMINTLHELFLITNDKRFP